MKLLSLSVENFGKLHRYDLTFDAGLNTLCEENGWGKTTLAAFLKAMFYGLPKSKSKKLEENELLRFTPWQGGAFGGNLTFACQKGTFRVERSFGEGESFALYDLKTGLPSSAFSERLGEELFGVDADGFERSVFLSSRALLPDQSNDTLHAKLTGIDEVYDMGSYEDAVAALEERAKDYKKRGESGKIGETELRIRNTKDALEQAYQKLDEQKELEKNLSTIRGQVAQLDTDVERLKKAALTAAQTGEILRRREARNTLQQQLSNWQNSFDGEVPSAEELEDCRKTFRQLEAERTALDTLGLTKEEETDLVALSAQFPARAPTPETLEEKFALASSIREKKALIRQETETQQRVLTDAEQKLAALPAPEDLTRIGRLLLQGKPKKQKSSPLFWAFVLLFALAGTGLLAFGILNNQFPFLIAGGVLLATDVLVALLVKLLRAHKAAVAKEREFSEIDRFLSRFDAHAKVDPRASIAMISEKLGHAEADRTAALKRLEELGSAEAQCAQETADLRAFLTSYGLEDADIESSLRRLSALARDWDRLWKKQSAMELELSQKKVSIAGLSKQLDIFFARCLVLDAGQDEQSKLAQMEAILSKIRSLQDELSRREEELQAVCREANIADPAQLENAPRLSELSAQEEARKSERAVLAEQANKLSAALGKLSAETESIPEWEEELARLTEELKDLKERYHLLTLTEKFLKQAHQDLTTRYLTPARESFANYLAKLCGKDVPDATLAANFSVTVLDSGKSRTVESYSRGWRDLLRFCVRLSIIDALYSKGEAPFLLLDDPFTNLDEERLAAAKDLLAKLAGTYQILHLVCHGDRA